MVLASTRITSVHTSKQRSIFSRIQEVMHEKDCQILTLYSYYLEKPTQLAHVPSEQYL